MITTRTPSYKERAQLASSACGKQLLSLMHSKKTNLAISADVTSATALIGIADSLGPEICMLKTHIDIIEDFSPALITVLRELSQKHQFLLFEDRKFADIGNTVKQQYEGGVYKIADWANIVNAHSLPGPGVVQGLASAGLKNERGLILIAEMSTNGHLMTNIYCQQTLAMAEQYPDFVIGFITRHRVSDDPKWINMTPGIQLETGGDTMGQQYITPESAIINQGTDIIIVGRGILQSKNPLSTAKIYRERGWSAYLARHSK